MLHVKNGGEWGWKGDDPFFLGPDAYLGAVLGASPHSLRSTYVGTTPHCFSNLVDLTRILPFACVV